MKKSYWNNNGKYQAFVNDINELAPSVGYTGNPYMNLFLVMSNLYHDAYDNGCSRVEECYRKEFARYVKPLLPVSIDIFINQDEAAMEEAMDLALELLFDHSLTYEKFLLWVDSAGKKFSLAPLPGIKELVFGLDDVRKRYLKGLTRLGWFTEVPGKEDRPRQPVLLAKLELAGMRGEKILVHYIGPCEGFYEDETVSYFGDVEQGAVMHDRKLKATTLPLKQYGTSWTATLAVWQKGCAPTDKLVRDRVPDIMEAHGDRPETRALTDEEFSFELDRKLQEKTQEYLCSHEIMVLADILEVVYAIAGANGLAPAGLENLRAKKSEERGGFSKKIFLSGTRRDSPEQSVVIYYETGTKRAGVKGHGFINDNLFMTHKEKEAFEAYNSEGRNYLSRFVRRDGAINTEYYNDSTKSWEL